jgi:hypothetical protein
MKKTPQRILEIRRETLRQLDKRDMSDVRGGESEATCLPRLLESEATCATKPTQGC